MWWSVRFVDVFDARMESDPAGAVAQLVTSVVDALRVMFVTYVEVTVVLDRSVLPTINGQSIDLHIDLLLTSLHSYDFFQDCTDNNRGS